MLRFHKLLILYFIFGMLTGCGQAENVDGETQTSSPINNFFIEDNFIFSVICSAFGILLTVSGVFYRKFVIKYQHPYKLFKQAESASNKAVKDDDIELAIDILLRVLIILEDDSKFLMKKSTGRNDVIWMLKRKLTELNLLRDDHNETDSEN